MHGSTCVKLLRDVLYGICFSDCYITVVQAYLPKMPAVTATPFVARLLRASQKDPGFRHFSARRFCPA